MTPAAFVSCSRLNVSYHDLANDPGTAKYPDPAFDGLLAGANASPTRALRMQRLDACERFALTAMPLIAIHFAVYSSPVKPYIRGWAWNALNEHHFKYGRIDRNRRPQ